LGHDGSVVDLAKPFPEGEGVFPEGEREGFFPEGEGEGAFPEGELAGERDKFIDGEFSVCFCTTIEEGEGIPCPAGDFLDLYPNIKQTYIPAKNTRAMNK
jgi:hypothetical protein